MANWDHILAFILTSYAVGFFVTHARRLRDVERKLDLIIAHLGIDPMTPMTTTTVTPSSLVVSLAADPKQRIAALKAYRQQTGAGLKEAVVVVDRIRGDSDQSHA
jgi:ribosomal protein L7/L12